MSAAASGGSGTEGTAWRPGGGRPRRLGPDLLLLLGFAVTSGLLLWTSPLVRLDVAVRDLADGARPEWAELPARAATYLGQGGPLSLVCLALALWVCFTRRTVRPALLFAAVWLALAPVQYLKQLSNRVAPHYPEPDNPPYVDAAGALLFSGADPAQSFPSGHAVNSAVFYGVILMLAPALSPRLRTALQTVPPIAVFLGQTYLGWHWVSDFPAGLALGFLLLRLAQRIRWERLPLGPLGELERRLQASPRRA